MKIVLFGLPLTGKSTVFKALAGFQGETTQKTKSNEPSRATVRIPDPRLDKLEEIYQSRRKISATVEYLDMPNAMGSFSDQHLKFSESFLAELRTCDALAHVVRVFESDSVPHITGNVDFLRDIKQVNSDLLIADLAVVENSLQKLEHRLKADSSNRDVAGRNQVLSKCKALLEEEVPLRTATWSEEEEKLLRNYQFLSQKPLIILLNLGEKQNSADYLEQARKVFANPAQTLITAIKGQVEMEISQLAPEEQGLFLQEMGINELALRRFIAECFDLLGRMYFFTVGEDEVRAWEIPKGSSSVTAAGTIHTDMRQGFICAEVFSYQDIIAFEGSESKLKTAGKIRLEGRDYIVKDGDILSIRFNVSQGKAKK